MAKQTVRTKTVKSRVKKGKGNFSLMVCNLCGGTGYQKKPHSKKK